MNDFNGENNIWLFFIGLFSCVVVGVAMALQTFYDYQPCAWCVFQRLIFIFVGLVSFGAFIIKANVITPIFTFIIGCIGQVVAGYQYFYASKSFSCADSLADNVMRYLNLGELIPGMFEIRAACADAVQPLLGISFEIWSFSGFFIICLFSMAAYINRYRYY